MGYGLPLGFRLEPDYIFTFQMEGPDPSLEGVSPPSYASALLFYRWALRSY